MTAVLANVIFKTSIVFVAPTIQDRYTREEIEGFLHRHQTGDLGRAGEADRRASTRSMEGHFGNVYSEFEGKDNTEDVQIRTNLQSKFTMIQTCEDFPAIGFYDDRVPPVFCVRW